MRKTIEKATNAGLAEGSNARKIRDREIRLAKMLTRMMDAEGGEPRKHDHENQRLWEEAQVLLAEAGLPYGKPVGATPVELQFEQEGMEEAFKDLVHAFPGLVNGNTDINGADLVDWLTDRIDSIVIDCGHEEDDEKQATFTYCGACGRVDLESGGG